MLYLKKNTVLKLIAYFDLFVLLFFACLLDSASWIPFIMCCITGGYLALFTYANNWFEREEMDKQSELIEIISSNSTDYKDLLIDFMNLYGLDNLREASIEQLEQYIADYGLRWKDGRRKTF